MTTKVDGRRGYAAELVSAVCSRGDNSPSAKFAKLCIEGGISVSQVADFFHVSRQTVYAWFTGASRPRPRHEELMRQLLERGGLPRA